MSGLLRNIIALLFGMLAYGSKKVNEACVITFFVTPFDTGVRILKSDKYLQFAETAQLDFLLKIGKLRHIVSARANFVNVAQLVKFSRPITVFSRVRVETRLVYADEKCAYFVHLVYAQGALAAEVLVKMKFKNGRITVPPRTFLTYAFGSIPEEVRGLEQALAAR